ncbi:HSCB C-terminal oligomerization domain-containing protein [Sordaria brevicollis]|uniref:HSCB C-terminal oligomerization domain-containing protein n=1 Tax=Sordaria brevicollis TaxID=83679 RepID=A0AAE0PCY2_SORBR|nr:HSCB C-terminal oligomerization domain-containing protein [Sordaria brevicollis]
MRASLLSSPATRALCAACRNEANRTTKASAAAFSTACAINLDSKRPGACKQSRPRVPTTTTANRAPQRCLYSTSSSSTEQKPSSSSSKPIPRYYSLFPTTLPSGPPPSGPFQIDLRALRREFLQLQAASHPDFHHSANQFDSSSSSSPSSEEQLAARRRAESLSSLINSAYRTLSSPLLRAQYLLKEIYGVDLAGDESTDFQSGNSDPMLLMTVLEAREQIEDAKSEQDLEPIREENDARIKESEEKLAEAFAREDVEGASKECVKLRYWMGIKEGCDEWEYGKPFVMHH